MKVFRSLLWIQGLYILIIAIWPLVHIESFMKVTGYKTDIWLVKTVGALGIPVGLTLLSYLFIRTDCRPAFVLGALTALAFAFVDFYYPLRDVISDIYIVDGWVQVLFLLTWSYIFIREYHKFKAPSPTAFIHTE
ncbi:hypothetical protein QNI19_11270 [Cytophagaceae bacterium DM2B3-1]|uniref:DoxX family protein n=1 Tax=Xanthocytophaga flava TaxID=3048013 RepID=A0ABT7CIF0_9BACT|nr:hypothetical protein [Xanthocytophaga flavus]MDJ1493514.1 hypothetical protein [Xanthocytophaga flavus]